MTSILEVEQLDTLSSNASSTITIGGTNTTTVNLGASGKSILIPSGATITNSGSSTGFINDKGYVGRVSSPNPVISTNTDTKLSFNTAIRNEGSVYNTSTGVFTAPVTGIYQVNAWVQHDGFSGTWQFEIHINGSSEFEFVNEHSGNATYPSSGISASIYLSSGQYFETYVRQNSGGNKTVYSSVWSHLSANLITEII